MFKGKLPIIFKWSQVLSFFKKNRKEYKIINKKGTSLKGFFGARYIVNVMTMRKTLIKSNFSYLEKDLTDTDIMICCN